MHNRKNTLFAAFLHLIGNHCSQSSQISGTSVGCLISDDAISGFEELIGERIGLIFIDGPKQSRKEADPASLELFCLCVLYFDELGFILVEDVSGDFCP